jgi:hypothetical protein
MDADETLQHIATAVARRRYTWPNEYQLQDELAPVLADTGLPVAREHQLPGVGRLDFYVDRIAVEVKVKGSVTEVIRQLGRYAKCDDVDGILLVTTVAHHTRIPHAVFTKPVVVVPLLGGLL